MNKMKGAGDISRQCVQISENQVSFLQRQHLKYLQPVYEHVLMNNTGHQKVRGHSSFRLLTYNYMYAISPDRCNICVRVLWAPGRSDAEVSAVASEQERLGFSFQV